MKAITARDFAAWAHATQRYGDGPYLDHLDEVAEIVRALRGHTEPMLDAAYLHDVVEDTPVTGNFLSEMFGPVVAVAVNMMTDPDGQNRAERKAALHARLAKLNRAEHSPRIALVVKAADRLANVRACVRDGKADLLRVYAREHAEFRAAAHRPGLCDALWDELDALAVE